MLATPDPPARPSPAVAWATAAARLRTELSPAGSEAFLEPVACQWIEAGVACLTVPSPFLRGSLAERHHGPVRAALAAVRPVVEQVMVLVRPAPPVPPAVKPHLLHRGRTMARIVGAVAARFGVDKAALLSHSRLPPLVSSRWIAMLLGRRRASACTRSAAASEAGTTRR